jgi:hypothetical protein
MAEKEEEQSNKIWSCIQIAVSCSHIMIAGVNGGRQCVLVSGGIRE